MNINNALVRNPSMWLCDVLEGWFQSAWGRLVRAVMSTVGGSDGK